ncbi:MAG: FAD/NAD(P)-binding protein [Micromonosporaceae bacterium]|nr:FAD/NAD(P)-binding protein [Micromonosporaceae bacterium]
MIPVPYRVVHRHEETADTVTVRLEPVGDGLDAWAPGQFTMVYAFGVGEIPISISGGSGPVIQHTVRAVGAVSRAICDAPVGSILGLRGPFGRGWPDRPPEGDVIVLAGGIGLAPLRPVILAGLREPGRLSVLIGARTPADLIFTAEYDQWRAAGARVLVTVDRADATWTGHVGVVTTLLSQVPVAPSGTTRPAPTGYICGPEIMMRLGADALVAAGVPPHRIWVSLERTMHCGIALCGHCQLGPILVCRDGPVVDAGNAARLLQHREL